MTNAYLEEEKTIFVVHIWRVRMTTTTTLSALCFQFPLMNPLRLVNFPFEGVLNSGKSTRWSTQV